MKRIIQRLIKLYGSISYIYIEKAVKKHSHSLEIEEIYQIYMSDYIYKDGKRHFTPHFDTIEELEEYLKENVEGYNKASTKK